MLYIGRVLFLRRRFGILQRQRRAEAQNRLRFSKEAKDVFEAGKKLWRHYHTQHAGSSQTGSYINVNASYYDIRKCFKGTDANGRMNNKSIDEKYNKLIKDLRDKMDILAKKIEPKIYEYGF